MFFDFPMGSMLSIVSPGLLARVLTCFRASYPNVEVVLFEGTIQLMEVAVGPSRIRPHIRYQASDSATILAMIREGLGITLMPGRRLRPAVGPRTRLSPKWLLAQALLVSMVLLYSQR